MSVEALDRVRLSVYPDGRVARFRVHDEVVLDPRHEVVLDPRHLTRTVDLLALENGGRLLVIASRSAPRPRISSSPAGPRP